MSGSTATRPPLGLQARLGHSADQAWRPVLPSCLSRRSPVHSLSRRMAVIESPGCHCEVGGGSRARHVLLTFCHVCDLSCVRGRFMVWAGSCSGWQPPTHGLALVVCRACRGCPFWLRRHFDWAVLATFEPRAASRLRVMPQHPLTRQRSGMCSCASRAGCCALDISHRLCKCQHTAPAPTNCKAAHPQSVCISVDCVHL